MDLPLGLGEPNPSQGTKMIAALPGAEDFRNPRADRAPRTIMRRERFGREPAMAFADKLRGPARGFDRLFERQSSVGAVGINLARLIRDDRRSDRNIGLVRRSCFDGADDAAVLVGGAVGLVALRGRARAVLPPGRLFVAFAGRARSRGHR